MAVLTLGLLGTVTELLLLEHYEEGWQLVPLGLIVATLGVLAWHGARPNGRNLRILQGLMALFLLAGAVGVLLHFRGAAEFQLEMDPSQARWDIFRKAMRAKDPPVLAPGLMLQLGLIGFAYSYHHPALNGTEPALRTME
jgi:hypothetical protein